MKSQASVPDPEGLERIFTRARAALGSHELGQRWLGTPNRSLGNQRPVDLLTTETDTLGVEEALSRTEFGVLP